MPEPDVDAVANEIREAAREVEAICDQLRELATLLAKLRGVIQALESLPKERP